MRNFDCDPAKRAVLLRDRHLDLLDMAEVFEDPCRLEFLDVRYSYGEERRVTIGIALGHVFADVYPMREPMAWLITALQANRRERAIVFPNLPVFSAAGWHKKD